MTKVIKFLFGQLQYETRDKREIALMREMGYDVTVVCLGETDAESHDSDGYSVYTLRKRNLKQVKARKIKKLCIVLSQLLQFIRILRNVRADAISCHDLPCLFVAWCSTWFMIHKPKLIYDSHEFELGRNTKNKRSRFKLAWIAFIEKFLIKKCAFSIMVCDSIADEVQRIYGLKERPVVVRNMADYWNINPDVCQEIRADWCKTLNTSSKPFFLIYHGMLMEGRGVERMIKMVSYNENFVAIVLGNGDPTYIEKLRKIASDLGLEKRVLFIPAVPITELWKYVGAADVEVIDIEVKAKSYYYALPNKFFESVQSETPIITGKLPEMTRLIEQYKIGFYYDSDDEKSLRDGLERMYLDDSYYQQLKNNLKSAKKELCWENEKRVLQEAYRQKIN